MFNMLLWRRIVQRAINAAMGKAYLQLDRADLLTEHT